MAQLNEIIAQFEVAREIGDLAQAQTLLERALEIEPRHIETLLLLADLLNRRRANPDASEALLRRAIAISPDCAAAWSELGQMLIVEAYTAHDKEALHEARRTLAQALKLEPNDTWARIHFARLLWNSQELPAAEENYRLAYHNVPDDDEMQRLAAGMFLADFLSAENIDIARAEQLLNAAFAREPEDIVCNYLLGKHWLHQKREEEARPLLQFAAAHGHKHAAVLLEHMAMQ